MTEEIAVAVKRVTVNGVKETGSIGANIGDPGCSIGEIPPDPACVSDVADGEACHCTLSTELNSSIDETTEPAVVLCYPILYPYTLS